LDLRFEESYFFSVNLCEFSVELCVITFRIEVGILNSRYKKQDQRNKWQFELKIKDTSKKTQVKRNKWQEQFEFKIQETRAKIKVARDSGRSCGSGRGRSSWQPVTRYKKQVTRNKW